MKTYKLFILALLFSFFACSNKEVTVSLSDPQNKRLEYGAEKLKQVLVENGYRVLDTIPQKTRSVKNIYINISNRASFDSTNYQKEGFSIKTDNNSITINGDDPSGTLYGCLELCEQIERNEGLPDSITISDKPEMVMRGAAIGLQKPEYLPGRKVYEYPITPENFPWFYDKELWVKYLDLLVENRMNSLYIWNGHPFASLVKLNDYPYAVEVNDSTYKLNKEMFSFITHEADKRGIWVIQMFYNIIVSKPFAEHHGIETQRRSRNITPIIADYTQKSIAAFIEEYPNVGLMVCLGEAMNTYEDDVIWFTETIIPGVKQGLEALGKEELPPIVLRGHDTDAELVMEAALPIYPNLYTTQKYNGESLTTYTPRGEWVEKNKALSELGSVHISNVHILANLEPFRYGSPDFIQKSVMAMHELYGANGLHLYPQSGYWDWPYTADKTSPRLLQIDRDWTWYKAWGRYAWKADRKAESEIEYWQHQLGNYFGNEDAGPLVLAALIESGEIAPKLLRTFGISDGNRQTLLLGMFMSQLVNPYKWRVYQSFLESNGPEGEILIDYAEKEWLGKPHTGETPPQIIAEVLSHAARAKQSILMAKRDIKRNRSEYRRLKYDIFCYETFSRFFANKAEAAMHVLEYSYSNDIHDLEKALPYLEESVKCYEELTELTKDTYLYANSMQTDLRRIPADGINGENKHWQDILPQFQQELENFSQNLEKLKKNGGKREVKAQEKYQSVKVELLGDHKLSSLETGQEVYRDKDFIIEKIAPELEDMMFIQTSYETQISEGTQIHFKNIQPVKLLVGYFNGHSFKILPPPTLETNALANERGQADIKIANALNINGLYPINIYTYYFEPGEHILDLGKGIVLPLGFIDGNIDIQMYDAGMGKDENVSIDWLFY